MSNPVANDAPVLQAFEEMQQLESRGIQGPSKLDTKERKLLLRLRGLCRVKCLLSVKKYGLCLFSKKGFIEPEASPYSSHGNR